MTNPLAAIPPEGSGEIITIEQQETAGLSQGAIVRRRFVRGAKYVINVTGAAEGTSDRPNTTKTITAPR